jgi:glyoxylase I family protein
MRIEHFALQVAEPAAMADWYVKNLGCTIARAGGPPAHGRFVLDSSGSAMLELYCNPAAPIPDYSELDPLLLHVAFVTNDPSGDSKKLCAAGAKVVGPLETTPSGDQIVMLRDPWNLALQLIKRQSPMLKDFQPA